VLIDALAPEGERARPLAVVSEALGVTTNNVAEYVALLLALDAAAGLGAREVELRLDSQLLVEQLSGRYRVRDQKLLPLHRAARERLERFERWSASHVPRGDNAAADGLANAALDRGDRPSEAVRSWVPQGLFDGDR
jgi:ribonuclease HI